MSGISTLGESRWCTSWYRSSGSPEKSLSMITRARGADAGGIACHGAVPSVQVRAGGAVSGPGMRVIVDVLPSE